VLLLAAGITRLLRSLLNKWTVRDGLWGEANWLFGRLQQLDGRPQAGLSFHEEVLRCFTAGERESGADEDPAGRS